MNIILKRKKFFLWRDNLNLTHSLLLTFVFTILTGISAQIKIPLIFTPVPITLQTFIVLIAGVILKKNYAVFSQVLYIILGIFGVKWFSGGKSGLSVLAGPTGGYLIGFVFAVYFIGHIRKKYDNNTNILINLILMFTADIFIVFGLGLLQFAIWFKLSNGNFLPFSTLLNMGFTPFIIGEFFKIFLAVLITTNFNNK
ncbi:biotin transport system substrate-specific component [Hypnocyclicus thermotrophus]|uniref:Biotin transporter n=1 Tax=Hypnocyclicus thermotrophus TaxID=1627895 RepID=A0AA46I5I7_9FUSO|nr:biotin transporter BioY [Hypnocyclicus thermotrophus]TDT70447.1 biotin transport system substrate-specific component [Hypnocyclicus thermotrophus]